MITLAGAQHIAAGWGHRQSLQRGYACLPRVDELTQGFAVWMQLPPGTRTEPGADVTTIIDRETGRVSHWPPSATTELDRIYTSRRSEIIDTHRTSDAEAELRRESHRRVSPAVAAHLTLLDRTFIARGAKGDQEELRHHPVIELWSDAPPGWAIRGAERHAEMLVLSDALFEADKGCNQIGRPPMNRQLSRSFFGKYDDLRLFNIRERGDTLGTKPALSCLTCYDMLTMLDVVRDTRALFGGGRAVTSGTDPQPGRFPEQLAWQLAAGGWDPARAAEREGPAEAAMAAIENTPGVEFRLQRFPAVTIAYAEFFGLSVIRKDQGLAHRIRPFSIGTGSINHLADALHQFGDLVGARMFPLGTEGFDEAVLVMDDRGRVFSIDQGGEWFLGETLDQALITLLTGAEAPRVRDDGSW